MTNCRFLEFGTNCRLERIVAQPIEWMKNLNKTFYEVSLACQCLNTNLKHHPNPTEQSQTFEHPNLMKDTGRTFEECMDWVKQEVPNAKAMYHDNQGRCIGYVTYGVVVKTGDDDDSLFCEFQPNPDGLDG